MSPFYPPKVFNNHPRPQCDLPREEDSGVDSIITNNSDSGSSSASQSKPVSMSTFMSRASSRMTAATPTNSQTLRESKGQQIYITQEINPGVVNPQLVLQEFAS